MADDKQDEARRALDDLVARTEPRLLLGVLKGELLNAWQSARSSMGQPADPKLLEWLRENAPDCRDNGCRFGGLGKGGMRTNASCRCFSELPWKKRVYVERLASAVSAIGQTDDARLLDWLEQRIFQKHWDGTLGNPPVWRMAGPYRHDLEKFKGWTLREAIAAAMGSADGGTNG